MRFQLLVCLTVLLWLLPACGGAAEEPPTPLAEPSVNATEAAPTASAPLETGATATPEALTTDVAITTPTSNPAVQPLSSTASTAQAEFNGVVFDYDPQLLTQVAGQFVPNAAGAYGWGHQGPPVYYWNVPDLVQFTFTTSQKSVRKPMIVIQPVRDTAGNIFPAYTEVELAEKFMDWETRLNAGENPFESYITGQNQLLEFANGRGIRQILHITNGTWPSEVTNQNLFYNYQGFTADGRYFIWAQIPLAAAGLSDDPVIPMPEFLELVAGAGDGDEKYYQEVFTKLNELQPEQFTPSLTVLDALVQTLFVPSEASLQSSILTADENCVDDSQFIEDVTIPDGMILEPRTAFIKTWAVKNSGNCIWNATYRLQSTEPTEFIALELPQIPVVLPGETVELTVVLQSPNLPGEYYVGWQLAPLTRSGIPGQAFGDTFFTQINVEETASPLLPPAGEWEIYHVKRTPQATLSQREAELWIGEVITLEEDKILFQNQSCEGVSYSGELVEAGTYLQNQYQLTAELIQKLPTAGIDVIRTNCSIAELNELIYLTNLKGFQELIVIKDGVLLLLKPR